MTLSKVVGIGAVALGMFVIGAGSVRVLRDFVDYGRTNFAVQFPYPDGPPLGAALLIGFGIVLCGVITILAPRALAALPLRD